MRGSAVAIVVLGVALAVALAVTRGLDVTGGLMLGLLVGVGVLALAVVRKAGGSGIAPATCRECGGVVSPNAPYCKHCGAGLRADP